MQSTSATNRLAKLGREAEQIVGANGILVSRINAQQRLAPAAFPQAMQTVEQHVIA
jgi:hypothetical protein